MPHSSIEEILEDYRNGKMVIITDDEDRENEGDLMMAADYVTAEDINFMARYGRGLICLTLTEDRCEKIGLPLMVGDNNGARFSTNFLRVFQRPIEREPCKQESPPTRNLLIL